MAEYTQEQLDQMIADAKKGLFSEEDLNKKVMSEVDRRVESGIQKGLETQKQKWEQEFTQKANMTAEELAKKNLEEKEKLVSQKERDILRRANNIDAKDMLSDAQIPKSQYEKVIAMLVTDDAETTKANVQNFINVFNETKTEIETRVKTEFSKVPPPKGVPNTDTVTKADFMKMPYGEKLKFKASNPEMYKEFLK